MSSKRKKIQSHSFHLVDPSPWPLIAAATAVYVMIGFVGYMCGVTAFNEFYFLAWVFASFISVMSLWWRDVIREASLEGQHTAKVQTGLRLGMLFFIVSEIMFFFAFFWAFFYSSFNPCHVVGGVWPPAYFDVLNAWKVPLFNTILLLSSGASVTWAHHSIVRGSKKEALIALVLTVLLAIVFTVLQVFEYTTASFTISDSVYGSTFYMATGFHGFHVFIGTCFLIVCFFRLFFNHFTREHHFGFEAAAWYWHFVDVVWLFLFLTIYWWGS